METELNLFEKFEGADLDRLVDCLKAVKSAGLTVDKYAQAGINQSSGNVYIWSEDFACRPQDAETIECWRNAYKMD